MKTEAYKRIAVLSLVGFVLLATMAAAQLSEAEKDALVIAHNEARSSITGARPAIPFVTWSAAVATSAQNWANQLKAQGCALTHSTGSGYGENLYTVLYMGSGGKTPEGVVASWMGEEQYYNAETGHCEGGVCGHFTQVVWRTTTQIGCGLVTCEGVKLPQYPDYTFEQQVWVCQYSPSGSHTGQKAY